jgi:RNA polymerase sigma-70 factor, ECF subfamily
MTSWPTTRYSFLKKLSDPAAHEAWSEFQSVYAPTVYRYARGCGLQQADASDVLQEVMLAVHQKAADWIPTNRPGSFRAWLAVTTRQIAFRTVRNKTRVGVTGRDDIEQPVIDDSEPLDDVRWSFLRAAAIVESEVQESTWRAFWDTAVHGHSAEDTARNLGLSIGTVYSARCRVLARIRRTIRTLSGEEQ